MTSAPRAAVYAMVVMGLWAAPADAQVVGTFRWQLLPHCNVVTLTVTQTGGQYTLDGVEDRCGDLPSGVTGVAFPLEDSIAMTFTSIGVYGAQTVHSGAVLKLQTLGGVWFDDLGRFGTFTYTPGAPVPGAVRPNTNRRGLGSVSVPVVLAARACGAYELLNPDIAEGDTILVEPLTVPAGLHLSPLIAGTAGRYAIMVCNGTASPKSGTVIAAVDVLSKP